MREIIRLIAFAVITFGITALALLFSNPEFTRDLSQRMGLIDPLEEGATERIAEGEAVIRLYRPHLGTWIGLQGFPSQTALRFPVPDVPGILGGQLHLDLDTDLIAHGDGLVTISINGRERDALVLDAGEVQRRLTYDLLPADIAAGEILVALHGNGTTNQGQICPTNVTNLGAAVEVSPTSAVLLQLSEPYTDAALQVVLAPDPLALAVSPETAMATWASQYLSRQGVAAGMAPGELTETILLAPVGGEAIAVSDDGRVLASGRDGIDVIGQWRAAALPPSYGTSWPLPVAALSTDLLAHTFRGSTRWTLDYKLADLPEGRAPARLRLALRTSELQGANYWTLRALLNGQLIHSSTHSGDGQEIRTDIDLPTADQGFANQLLVTLIDNSPNDGICRAGPEAAAQMLADTVLDPADTPANDKQALVARLAAADDIGFTADESDIGIAARAAGLLDLALPLDRTVVFNQDAAVDIELVDLSNASEALSQAAGNGFLVVPAQNGVQDGVDVLPIDIGGEGQSRPSGATPGLLVTW